MQINSDRSNQIEKTNIDTESVKYSETLEINAYRTEIENVEKVWPKELRIFDFSSNFHVSVRPNSF